MLMWEMYSDANAFKEYESCQQNYYKHCRVSNCILDAISREYKSVWKTRHFSSFDTAYYTTTFSMKQLFLLTINQVTFYDKLKQLFHAHKGIEQVSYRV